MLPRLVLRVRRAVRRLTAADAVETSLSGPEVEARWGSMLDRVRQEHRAAERRLDSLADALNRPPRS